MHSVGKRVLRLSLRKHTVSNVCVWCQFLWAKLYSVQILLGVNVQCISESYV